MLEEGAGKKASVAKRRYVNGLYPDRTINTCVRRGVR